jgi:lipopolysaccharide transport system permease protein
LVSVESDDIVVLEPKLKGRHYLRELWSFRELFLFLAWRDILVRYKQTAFGVAWALARPLATTMVFAFAFGRVAALPSQGVPYPLFVLAGMLPWQLFASSLADASGSLVANANIVSKVYFPRLLVPASTLAVGLVDLAFSALAMFALMVWYGAPFTWRVALMPGFVGLALMVSLGASLWLSALNVRYRDVRYVIPFIVQLGLLISPVGYDSDVVPASARVAYSYNPMVAPIDGMRWCLLGAAPRDFAAHLLVSAAAGVVLLITGYLSHRGRGCFQALHAAPYSCAWVAAREHQCGREEHGRALTWCARRGQE